MKLFTIVVVWTVISAVVALIMGKLFQQANHPPSDSGNANKEEKFSV